MEQTCESHLWQAWHVPLWGGSEVPTVLTQRAAERSSL